MFKKLVAIENTLLHEDALKKLSDYAACVELHDERAADEDELIRRIGDADAVLVSFKTTISKTVLDACPNIRYIGMCCTLYEQACNVDLTEARKLGITVVVITHQMSVVEEICDSVAILDGGVVVEQGSVQEIFANPKTAAAKRLVAPNGGSAARDLSCFAPDDHVVRVTFNGSSTAKPLVASLAAEKGILVSVLSADTRDLSGQCYGSMLLKLPAELAVAQQAMEYMRSQSGVTVEEVTGI